MDRLRLEAAHLDFDFSDEDSGRGSFDAMASVLPDRLPALLAEIAAVLGWAARTGADDADPHARRLGCILRGVAREIRSQAQVELKLVVVRLHVQAQRIERLAVFALLQVRQNRFALAFRLHNMKTEAGRKRKIASFVQMLKNGETIYPQTLK
jgi:hypothetical protein